MKIFTLIEELLGKKPYKDNRLQKLKEKFNPPRITYYAAEFTNQNKELCDCLLVDEAQLLDLIVEDMEKAEALLNKAENTEIIKKVLSILEENIPLSSRLTKEEANLLKNYNFITLKPVIFAQNHPELSVLLEKIFKANSAMFFFTVNKKEARAWLADQFSDILSCAAKIHTDLAKGFIRAEVYNIKDLDSFKNTEEAKQRGIFNIVDKNYAVNDGDVINIKFKV